MGKRTLLLAPLVAVALFAATSESAFGQRLFGPVVVDANGQVVGSVFGVDYQAVGQHGDLIHRVWVLVQANGYEFAVTLDADRFKGLTELSYTTLDCSPGSADEPYVAVEAADWLANGIVERGFYDDRDGNVYIPDRESGAVVVTFNSVYNTEHDCFISPVPAPPQWQNVPSYTVILVDNFDRFVPPFRLTVRP